MELYSGYSPRFDFTLFDLFTYKKDSYGIGRGMMQWDGERNEEHSHWEGEYGFITCTSKVLTFAKWTLLEGGAPWCFASWYLGRTSQGFTDLTN